MIEDIDMKMLRGETEQEIGGHAGESAGGTAGESGVTAYGGPIGAAVGKYVDEKVRKSAGEYLGGKMEDTTENAPEKSRGGSCGGGAGGAGVGQYSASDGQCHKTDPVPKTRLSVQENNLPENWWDKLPDFDPRVYDAIAMEQAAACVKYVFNGLPDMHELEHLMESRKNRKTCPRLKTQVPRTKVIRPRELKYEVKIDSWMKKDQTY